MFKITCPICSCSFESEMKFSLLKMSSTYTGWNSESLCFAIRFHTAVFHPLRYLWKSIEKFWFWDHDTPLVLCNDRLFGVWVSDFHPFQGAKSFLLRAVVISWFYFFFSAVVLNCLLFIETKFIEVQKIHFSQKW